MKTSFFDSLALKLLICFSGAALLAACGGGEAQMNEEQPTLLASTSWTLCANQNQFCAFSGAQAVRYGAGSSFYTRTAIGGIACNTTTFGDPAPGVAKHCDVIQPVWTICANENQQCAFSGTKVVRYGANGSYATKSLTGGTTCNNAKFGDPLPTVRKHCDIASVPTTTSTTTSSTAASSTTTSTTTSTAVTTTTSTAVTTSSTTSTVSTTTTTLVGQLDPAFTCALGNFQQEIIDRVNQARAVSRTCGTTVYNATAALQWNSKLFNASAGHSNDMASNNYFSHTSLDGRTFDQRITAAGYQWSTIGENIAAGQGTVEQAISGWLASAGHCANIMNPSFTEFAVACVKNPASTYKTYWTMDLGRP